MDHLFRWMGRSSKAPASVSRPSLSNTNGAAPAAAPALQIQQTENNNIHTLPGKEAKNFKTKDQFETHASRIHLFNTLQSRLERLLKSARYNAISSVAHNARKQLQLLQDKGLDIAPEQIVYMLDYPRAVASFALSQYENAFKYGSRMLPNLHMIAGIREQTKFLNMMISTLWRIQTHTKLHNLLHGTDLLKTKNAKKEIVKKPKQNHKSNRFDIHDLKMTYHWMLIISHAWLERQPLDATPLINRAFWQARLGYFRQARADFLKCYNRASHSFKRKLVRNLLPHINQGHLIRVVDWIPHEVNHWMLTLGHAYRRYACAAINSALTGKKLLELAHLSDIEKRNAQFVEYFEGVVLAHVDRICEEILWLEQSDGLSLSNSSPKEEC